MVRLKSWSFCTRETMSFCIQRGFCLPHDVSDIAYLVLCIHVKYNLSEAWGKFIRAH